MDIIKEQINSSRTITNKTLDSYLYMINNLHKKRFGKNLTNIEFLLDYQKTIDSMDDLKESSKKTYLSSIVVVLDSNADQRFIKVLQDYRNLMNKYIDNYNTELTKQIKTVTQKENWLTIIELRKVIPFYYKQLVFHKIFKKKTLSKNERSLLQYWLIANLYIGDSNQPPIRLEYGEMKIIQLADYNKLTESQQKHNFLILDKDNKYFSLGDYKTGHTYGIKTIAITNKINKILTKYLKNHTSDYLLLNTRGNPMTSNGLIRLIKEAFKPTEKHITVNLLRHIYISEFNKGVLFEKKALIADKMGHSISTQEMYRKQ